MNPHSWTKRETEQLESLWDIGFKLNEISERLRIPEENCNEKAKELGLRERIVEARGKDKRPAPIYTNTRSYYGIADELHATPNRILK